jgi:thiol-disulfide isomerase/thioredoxin
MRKTCLLSILCLLLFTTLSPVENELTGPLSEEKILKTFPDWKKLKKDYKPSTEIITYLQSVDFDVSIEIVLGTWCPDSKIHVSAFFRIMEEADNPYLSVSYLGIPKNKEARLPFIRGKNIEGVPTFIVFLDNAEAGRIVETPLHSLEADLMGLITPPVEEQLDVDLEFFRSNYHADLSIDCTECHKPQRRLLPKFPK